MERGRRPKQAGKAGRRGFTYDNDASKTDKDGWVVGLAHPLERRSAMGRVPMGVRTGGGGRPGRRAANVGPPRRQTLRTVDLQPAWWHCSTDHGSATARAPPAARMGRLAGGLERARGRSAGWDSLTAGQLGAVNSGVQWQRQHPPVLDAIELLQYPLQGGPAAKSLSATALRSVSPVP